MYKIINHYKNNIFLAVISGVLLTTSFPNATIPDGDLSWLAWISLVPLFFSLNNLSPKACFNIGLLMGSVHYLTLIYWVTYTMQIYGKLPLYLSVPALLLFSFYLSLYIAIFSYAMSKICSHPLSFLFVAPILWISLEYIRTFLLSGFPWELLGYSQFNRLSLIQITDITGVYGVSFIIVLSNAIIFIALLKLAKTDWQGESVSQKLFMGAIITLVLVFSIVWGYGKHRIGLTDELIAKSITKNIAVIQGNIPQSQKWIRKFQISSTQKYLDASFSTKIHKPDLIVWPETATPFYYRYNKKLTKKVQQTIKATGSHFLFGSPSFKQREKSVNYYNSAYLINPETLAFQKYDKVHLVPFGEFVPFKKVLSFIDKMVVGIGDFSPGMKGSTLELGNCKIGVQICYEIIFPNLSKALVANDAALIVNITNDAWFGKTGAPYQHFYMAVFRAIENKRSLIRSANTGISGFIDPVGRIIAKTSLFEDAAVTRTMPVLKIKTLYTRFGDLFAIACMAASVIFIFLHRLKGSGKKR